MLEAAAASLTLLGFAASLFSKYLEGFEKVSEMCHISLVENSASTVQVLHINCVQAAIYCIYDWHMAMAHSADYRLNMVSGLCSVAIYFNTNPV